MWTDGDICWSLIACDVEGETRGDFLRVIRRPLEKEKDIPTELGKTWKGKHLAVEGLESRVLFLDLIGLICHRKYQVGNCVGTQDNRQGWWRTQNMLCLHEEKFDYVFLNGTIGSTDYYLVLRI